MTVVDWLGMQNGMQTSARQNGPAKAIAFSEPDVSDAA